MCDTYQPMNMENDSRAGVWPDSDIVCFDCFAGLGLPAVFLVSTGFIKCDNTLAVVMICLSLGTAGFAMSGFNCNHLDIGPQFAGE